MSTIQNLFNSLKQYQPEWNLVEERTFSEEELQTVEETVEVIASKYGKSVCFTILSNGKKTFLPTDSQDLCDVGDKYPTSKIKIAKLKYVGTNPDILKNLKPDRCVTRARIISEDASVPEQIKDFNNPFGI